MATNNGNNGASGGGPSRKRRYYDPHDSSRPGAGPGPRPDYDYEDGHVPAGVSSGFYQEYRGPSAPYSPYPDIPQPRPQPPRPVETPGAEATTNLIVNYLPQTLADEELHEMFAPYGEIGNLRIVRDKNVMHYF